MANTKQLHQEIKRKFVIERLLESRVTHSQDGTRIYDLSYEDLKHELVMQAFREIDVKSDSNQWF